MYTFNHRIVDAHAHFMTYDTVKTWMESGVSLDNVERRVHKHTDMTRFQVPDSRWDTAQLWMDEMDKYGITAMGFMVDKPSLDEFIAAKTRFPGCFMGYAVIDPEDPDAAEQIERAGTNGLQGIKLYPSMWPRLRVNDQACYPLYEVARKHGLLVILHFGITIGGIANLRSGNPLDIQVPAQQFPELDFMIAHFGAGFFREVLMLQYQTDNVCMDTSGSNSWIKYQPVDLSISKLFEKAVDAAGPDRVVFGTDSSFFPRGFRYNILEEQFHAVKSLCSETSLCLTKDQVDLIFSGNILRLTRFEPRTISP